MRFVATTSMKAHGRSGHRLGQPTLQWAAAAGLVGCWAFADEGRAARWNQYGFAILPFGQRTAFASVFFHDVGDGILQRGQRFAGHRIFRFAGCFHRVNWW